MSTRNTSNCFLFLFCSLDNIDDVLDGCRLQDPGRATGLVSCPIDPFARLGCRRNGFLGSVSKIV